MPAPCVYVEEDEENGHLIGRNSSRTNQSLYQEETDALSSEQSNVFNLKQIALVDNDTHIKNSSSKYPNSSSITVRLIYEPTTFL